MFCQIKNKKGYKYLKVFNSYQRLIESNELCFDGVISYINTDYILSMDYDTELRCFCIKMINGDIFFSYSHPNYLELEEE